MAYPISVDGKQVEFITDTGSDASIIPLRVFDLLQKRWGKHVPLLRDKKDDFRSINDDNVPFQGYFNATLKFGNATLPERMYITNNAKSPNLLSENACLALGLITYSPGGYLIGAVKNERKQPTQTDLPDLLGLNPTQKQRADELHKKWGEVYRGLGKLKGFQARLELSRFAKDFFHRAPPVALHLQDPGKTRVDELELRKIWERVNSNQPLRFCSALLVLPKQGRPNDCRLVGNYTPLNEALERTSYVPQMSVY